MDKFKEIYQKIRPMLLNNYNAVATIPITELVDNSFNSIIKNDFEDTNMSFNSDNAKEKAKDETNLVKLVIEFIYLVDFNAYYDKANIDVARLKELPFGYDGHTKQFVQYLNNFKGQRENNKDADEKIINNLLSCNREVDLREYVKQGLYEEDILNVKELMGNKEEEIKDEELISLINKAFKGAIENTKGYIENRYKFIMEGAFSTEDYVGVYTGQTQNSFVGIKNRKVYTIEPDYYLSQEYRDTLEEYLDCDYSTKRQFDFTDIYNNFGKKVLYFPYKILEIAKRTKFTKETQLPNYRDRIKGYNTLDKYVDYLISDFFTDNINDYMVFICKKKADKQYLKKILENRRNQNIIDWDVFEKEIKELLAYYTECVTTAVILDKLTAKDTEIEDFRIKICSDVKKEFSNTDFIETLSKKMGKDFHLLEDVNSTDMKEVFGKPCITVGYTANKKKIDAMPIFAYRALDAMNGEQLDWNNILLGKDVNDKLITSSVTAPIKLQKNRLHFIIAGSRSGKGVMCYNIFATALASQLPLFYIDGKPDTSLVIKDIEPQAFAINHGSHDDYIDYKGVLSPDNYNAKYPAYMADFFGGDSDEKIQLRNDFATFRTITLVLTMIYYCDKFKCEATQGITDKIKEVCGRGIVLVLDEMSKYMGFVNQQLTTDGTGLVSQCRSKNYFTKTYEEDRNKASKIKDKIAKEEKKGNTQEIEELQKELSNLQYDLKGQTLYATAFTEMFHILTREANNLAFASGGLWKTMHIFFIGQSFDEIKIGNSHEAWFNPAATSSLQKYNASHNVNPFINMLFSQPSDVIVGYQPENQSYMAQDVKGTKTNLLFTQSRRFFAYQSMNMTEENINKIMNTQKATGNNPNSFLSDWTYFKPFLILNNAVTPGDEMGEEIAEEDIYSKKQEDAKALEPLSKGKVNGSAGKPYLESQYVAQCLVQSLDAGIEPHFILDNNTDESGKFNEAVGFEGYINKMSNGNIEEIKSSLRLPTEIANLFVQEIIGYPGTWEEFVYDFRPQWMFSLNTFDTKTGKLSSVEERFKETYFLDNFKSDRFKSMYPDILADFGVTEGKEDEVKFYKANEEIEDYTKELEDKAPEYEVTEESEDIIPEEQEYNNSEEIKEITFYDILELYSDYCKEENKPESIYGLKLYLNDIVALLKESGFVATL